MEQELGPTHIRTLRTFNNVGVLYYDRDKLEQAEEYYLRALGGKSRC
jgi:Tfp pilus assembly protein PilF